MAATTWKLINMLPTSNQSIAPYHYDRTLHWGDTDAARIVYTGNYFPLCLEAIEGWFRHVLEVDWFEMNINLGIGTPFVHAEVDINKPLTPQNQLRMSVYVERLGNKSLTFRVEGLRDPHIDTDSAFTGTFTCCFTQTDTFTSTVIPRNFRERIERYRKETAD